MSLGGDPQLATILMQRPALHGRTPLQLRPDESGSRFMQPRGKDPGFSQQSLLAWLLIREVVTLPNWHRDPL
jgi:hypothetical protein